LRKGLGDRARQTVESTYAWDVIGEHLLDQYLAVTHAT